MLKQWNQQIANGTSVRLSFRNAALASGISLILMAIPAGAANFQVIETIKGSGITLSMVPAIRWAFVAWGLYEMFRRENPSLSLLTAWFIIIYTAVLILSIMFLFTAARIVPGNGQSAGESFNIFNDGWMLGLVFFGIHLALLGRLCIKSRYVHWIFGTLVLIAGIGYMAEGIGAVTAPGGPAAWNKPEIADGTRRFERRARFRPPGRPETAQGTQKPLHRRFRGGVRSLGHAPAFC
ncbi:MAG: DUF4386 domain-containing protein [Spirochaetaceae bacterium]|nr:DUF4386 domain-containing protein [Spirochaetaceae bacterium]